MRPEQKAAKKKHLIIFKKKKIQINPHFLGMQMRFARLAAYQPAKNGLVKILVMTFACGRKRDEV